MHTDDLPRMERSFLDEIPPQNRRAMATSLSRLKCRYQKIFDRIRALTLRLRRRSVGINAIISLSSSMNFALQCQKLLNRPTLLQVLNLDDLSWGQRPANNTITTPKLRHNPAFLPPGDPA